MKLSVGSWLLSAGLLAGLAGCSLLRPYRIPDPKTPPEIVAQRKAKAKAAKEGKKKPAAPDAAAVEETATVEALPVEASTETTGKPAEPVKAPKLKYDSDGLVKKPKLLRRRYHKPAKVPLGQSIRNFFKYKLHGKPKYDRKPGAKPAAPDGLPPADSPAPEAPFGQ